MSLPLAGVQGLLIDLDGTVYVDDTLIPGVVEAIRRCSDAGLSIRFGTNTTRMSYQDVRGFIATMGLEIPDGHLFTAPVAAARVLQTMDVERIALYLPEETHPDFAAFVIDDDHPDAVVVGDLGPAWSFDRLNRAFRQILGGARLVGLQRNRYWKVGGQLTLDAGPVLAALEYATGTTATIAGKPSPAFFQGAAAAMKIPLDAMVVVGDDIRTDIQGGLGCGARGVLVRTGKFREADLGGLEVEPTAVVASLADLPALLGC